MLQAVPVCLSSFLEYLEWKTQVVLPHTETKLEKLCSRSAFLLYFEGASSVFNDYQDTLQYCSTILAEAKTCLSQSHLIFASKKVSLDSVWSISWIYSWIMASGGQTPFTSNGYLVGKTEIQIHIHDSECHPLKDVNQTLTCDRENLAVKVVAFSTKEPDLKIPIEEKLMSKHDYHKDVQNASGRVYKEGEYLIYSCRVKDFHEIVLEIELLGLGSVLYPCKLLGSHHEKLCLPVFGKDCGAYKGIFQFDCLIITPWRNEAMKSFGSNVIHWHPDSVDGTRSLEMGHRGCGTTHGKLRSASTPVENTIVSFTKAFEKGADYVELDVQLTKDLVPIVFHDFSVAAFVQKKTSKVRRKIEIAVNDLKSEELSNLQFSFTGEPAQVGDKDVDGVTDDLSADLLPTLEQVLKESPPDLGIFIELKYPMQEKSGSWESNGFVDKNKLVERTLDVVYSVAGKRRIIFGSFDPSVCAMLRLKQPFYKVVLITSGENDIYPMCMDHRCRTLNMAVNFALSEDLLGISIMWNPLVKRMPDVLKQVQNKGLRLFTWGDANVDQKFIEHQKELGITGIIYDRLHELKS